MTELNGHQQEMRQRDGDRERERYDRRREMAAKLGITPERKDDDTETEIR